MPAGVLALTRLASHRLTRDREAFLLAEIMADPL